MSAPAIVTNWITAPPGYREFNGRVCVAEEFEGDCLKVLSNGVVLQAFKMKRTYRTDRPDYLQRSGNFYGRSPDAPSGPTRHLVSEERIPGKKFFVRNYPRTALGPTVGEVIRDNAIRVGTVDYQGETLELWDYGTPHVVPVVVTNYPVAYLRQVEAKRHAAAKEALLKFYQPKAKAGDGFAQLRLGEIYLHGEGVETNVALARRWLSAALTNGYPQAANLLTEIERNTRAK